MYRRHTEFLPSNTPDRPIMFQQALLMALTSAGAIAENFTGSFLKQADLDNQRSFKKEATENGSTLEVDRTFTR